MNIRKILIVSTRQSIKQDWFDSYKTQPHTRWATKQEKRNGGQRHCYTFPFLLLAITVLAQYYKSNKQFLQQFSRLNGIRKRRRKWNVIKETRYLHTRCSRATSESDPWRCRHKCYYSNNATWCEFFTRPVNRISFRSGIHLFLDTCFVFGIVHSLFFSFEKLQDK